MAIVGFGLLLFLGGLIFSCSPFNYPDIPKGWQVVDWGAMAMVLGGLLLLIAFFITFS